MTGPFRLPPLMPPQAYKTYSMRFPLRTHFRPATCDEVACPAYLHGWKTILPAGHPQVDFVRSLHGRWFFTEQPAAGGLTEFTFPAGQRCFAASEHRVPLEREPLFVVTGGDWRGNPMNVPARVHARGEDWADDFAAHQDKIAVAIQRG